MRGKIRTMRFINKWYIILWVIIILASVFFSYSSAVICRDGEEFDEEKLMQDCNITPEEYIQQLGINNSFCPEGRQSVRYVGGCGPDWEMVRLFMIVPSLIYNLIYVVVYLILRKKEH